MDTSKYPKRKSPRLKDYDYSQDGAYFITICTENRLRLFGHIDADGEMCHNLAGLMLFHWWDELANKYNHINLDSFVVMPNHIHGIIVVHTTGDHAGSPLQTVLGWYKTMTTNAYIRGVKNDNWKPYHGKLWQRTFHDRVIRNEMQLNSLREYTLCNPASWAEDHYYSDI